MLMSIKKPMTAREIERQLKRPSSYRGQCTIKVWNCTWYERQGVACKEGRMSVGADERPAAQRRRAEDGSRVDTPTVGSEAGCFRLSTLSTTGPAKPVAGIRRPGRKTGLRAVTTSNPEAGEFDAHYTTKPSMAKSGRERSSRSSGVDAQKGLSYEYHEGCRKAKEESRMGRQGGYALWADVASLR
eukprot:IDg14744t1